MLSFPSTKQQSAPSFRTPGVHAEQILHGLPLALMALLPDRRLVYVNERAERFFEDLKACRMGERLMGVGQLKANRIEALVRLAASGSAASEGLWFAEGLRTGSLEILRIEPWLLRSADWPADCLLLSVHMDEPALTQAARIDAVCQQCRLTATERYVLMLLADGMAVETVARHLDLQVSTLRSHVRNLLGKTQAHSLMELVRWTGSVAYLNA